MKWLDSILYPFKSEFGWIIKSEESKRKEYILNEFMICSSERRQELKKQYPEYFISNHYS